MCRLRRRDDPLCPSKLHRGFEGRKLLASDGGLAGHADLLVAGIVASLLSGLVAIRFLLAYLQRRSLHLFVAYRVIAAAAVMVWLLS